MATQIQLQSTNYNGQIADITFYPCSGGTISLGNQTIPYTYTNDNYEGTYDLFFSAFNQTCQLVITCPTPTPTVTPTNTATPTPTTTPTQTPTPSVSPGPLIDPDAQAFFNAITASGGTLTTTEQSAVNTLVIDLKGYNLWNKMIGLYPVVGTTSVTQSFNLKDPTTYNLSFSGTWAHTAGGAEPTSTGYARTGMIPSIINFNSLGSIHGSMYITENLNTSGYDMGAIGGGEFDATSSYGNNIAYIGVNTGNFTAANGGTTKRNFLWTNNGSTSSIYANGGLLGSGSYGLDANTPNEIILSGINLFGYPAQFTGRNWALASIGLGMNSTEAFNYNTAVLMFQTTLGRQN